MDFCASQVDRCSTVGLACRIGELSTLQQLVDDGAVLDAPDNRGWMPIHEAAFSGHFDCLNLIAQKNTCREYVNSQAHDGTTALLLAVQKQHIQCVDLLITMGADVNLGTSDHMRPLMACLRHKNMCLVDSLLSAGANPLLHYWNNWTCHHEAAMYDFVLALPPLLKGGLSLGELDDDGLSVVFVCAQYGHYLALQQIYTLIQDSSVRVQLMNEPTRDGTTPVYIAAQEGHSRTLECLIQQGALVDTLCPAPDQDDHFVHSVVPATRRNHNKCVTLILENCRHIHCINQSAEDPVMHAVDMNAVECLQTLLKFKLPLERASRETSNIVTSHEYLKPLFHRPKITPLGRAVIKQRMFMIELLIESGAECASSNHEVFSAVLLAVHKRQQPNILRMFIRNMVNLNLIASNSRSQVPDVLMVAVHPLFTAQLVQLLQCNTQPNLHNWCYCNNQDYSLLHELLGLFPRKNIDNLVQLLRTFVQVLPKCCPLWTQWTQNEPCSLVHCARLRIRSVIRQDVLLDADWLQELPVPNHVTKLIN